MADNSYFRAAVMALKGLVATIYT